MDNLNKKLACGLWAVSGISTLISVIIYISFEYYVGMIGVIVAVFFNPCLVIPYLGIKMINSP